MSDATIWVTTRFVGYHVWADAPPGRAYLGARHRHLFGVRVSMPVEHDDREVEFHDVLDQVAAEIGLWDRKSLGSCEMMARGLAGKLAGYYGRSVTVSISEDDECGAEVTA